MKVGLVLGAGGIQGGAWLTGGLDALAAETGWDPADGRLRGRHLRRLDDGRALRLRAFRPGSWSPTRAARCSRASSAPTGARPPRPTARAAPGSSSSAPCRRSAPAPGGWRCARSPTPAATRPPPCSPAGSRAASSPPSRSRRPSAASFPAAGARIPTSGSSPATTRPAGACPSAAPALPRPTSPTPSPPPARIPGIYHPQTIGGRRYVDGGIYSTSNADLLRDQDLDLVICLNPTSTLHPVRAPLNPREWLQHRDAKRLRPAARERGEEASRRAAPRSS